ncbi:MAG TPA: EAL domain-containing protein, partial [Rubellimicrobium sp.]|nr:EAL domain-containing protein [Rubellimicrobium sp.]
PVPRADMSRVVREAVAQNRMRLAFQPVVTAAPRPELLMHEGFIRILDARGHVIPASGFVSAVEESPLGRELDCATLRLGFEALRRHPLLHLSLNMSARSVGNPAWRAILEDGAAQIGPRLTLEFGESSLSLLPDRVIRLMDEMTPKGLRFALDEFGAGAVGLRALRSFGFHHVKLDRQLVAGIDASGDHQVVAAALIAVAHQYGMDVAAVGVETEAEAARLRRLGADYLQGYLFGRPRARL